MQKLIPFEIMNCVKEGNKNVLRVTVNRPERKVVVTGQLVRRMKNLSTSDGRGVSNISGSRIKYVTF